MWQNKKRFRGHESFRRVLYVSWILAYAIYSLKKKTLERGTISNNGGVLGVFVYRSGGQGRRRAGERDHFLDGQTQFESVQRVADSNLSLDLCVRQGGHDGSTLHVGTTGCYIPGWHPDPQLFRAVRTTNVNTTVAINVHISGSLTWREQYKEQRAFFFLGHVWLGWLVKYLQPWNDCGTIPLREWKASFPSVLQKLMPEWIQHKVRGRDMWHNKDAAKILAIRRGSKYSKYKVFYFFFILRSLSACVPSFPKVIVSPMLISKSETQQ